MNNAAEASELKKELLADTQVLPIYQQFFTRFEVVSVGDFKKDPMNATAMQRLTAHVDTVVNPGVGIVDLTWDYKGKTLQTVCVVSAANGRYVYDHLLGNIVESSTVETGEFVEPVNTKAGIAGSPARYQWYQEYTQRDFVGEPYHIVSVRVDIYGERNGNYKAFTEYELYARQKKFCFIPRCG